MPMGTRHQVTGVLLQSGHGLVIEVDGGGQWILDADHRAPKLLGHRVIVEGVRSGFNMLDVDSIKQA